MSITDIVTNIDQRLADIDAELTHLNGARTALIDAPASEVSPKPRQPRRARRTATATASYDVAPAATLIARLSGSAGMSTRELARVANADPAHVLASLKEQEDTGQVRRSGTRAATRWHVITDEDRIAARVAELEAGSRRRRARRN